MKTIALRRLAHVNPPAPNFDRLAPDADVLFLPLETVWADDRADQGRRVPKSQVSSGYSRFQAGDVVSPKVTPPSRQVGPCWLMTSELAPRNCMS